MDYAKEMLRPYAEWKGKLDADPKMEVNTKDDLSPAYTPGIAAPCLEIEKDTSKGYELTGRGNLAVVVTDETATLGLGDIEPEVGMPVVEGKCALFKEFGSMSAIPLCIKSKDADEIAHTIALLSGSFGGINLENITVPRCSEIKAKLKKLCDIPVFYDDQHGITIVTAAALLNAVKLIGKDMGDLCIVISGAGFTGIAIIRLLLNMKLGDIILCDSEGSAYKGKEDMNAGRKEIVEPTNKGVLEESLADVMKGSDIFIGVSTPDVMSEAMVISMDEKSAILPMTNPVPEIMPDKAEHAGAFIVGTGRSNSANQINNVLVFSGTFRDVLGTHASDINEGMETAAVYVIASLVSDEELSVDYIISSTLSKEVGAIVAEAVARATRGSGVARI